MPARRGQLGFDCRWESGSAPSAWRLYWAGEAIEKVTALTQAITAENREED